MATIAIAAQLCGNAKIVGCASDLCPVPAPVENRVSRLMCNPGTLPRF
jgi:hypothetical protein